MRFPIWMLIAIVLVPSFTAMAAENNYKLYFSDGAQQPFDSIAKLLTADRNHDEIKKLFNRAQPLQMILRAGAGPKREAPYLELASGDVLPAKIIRYESAGPDGVPPAHYCVQPTHWPVADSPELRVRASDVRRIVFQAARSRPFQKNQIVVADGRVLNADRISLQADGVRALGDFGAGASRFATFSFSELDELHFDSTSPAQAMASDGLFAQAINDPCLATISDNSGGRYTQTLSRSRVERMKPSPRDNVYVEVAQLQPLWLLDAIWLDIEAVTSIAYRRPDEMPLANLPADQAQQTKVVHAWKWRTNSNVAGGRMAVQDRGADTGFGVHANQAIAVSLPAGSKTISGYVGVDQSVGRRGYARAMIRRDSINGGELWKSEFLRGGEPADSFTKINVAGAKQVVLVADAAASKFPDGADPLDIGDHIDWLAPMATVDLQAIHSQPPYHEWMAGLANWNLPADAGKRLKITNFWNERLKQWNAALDINFDGEFRDKPFLLTRTEKVSLRNAFLFGEVSRSSDNEGSHLVTLLVDSEKGSPSMNGGLSTTYLRKHRASNRVWILGDLVGDKTHELSLSINPDRKKSSKAPDPILIHKASLVPLVKNLASDGKLIVPSIALESLAPTKIVGNREDLKFAAGTLTNGEPLLLRAFPLKQGIGVPSGVSLHYDLKPAWKRFVAVIGLADGWQQIGPFQVFVDGEIVYESIEPTTFGRNNPGEQINLELPSEAKEMILKIGGQESFGAWGFAGFVTE